MAGAIPVKLVPQFDGKTPILTEFFCQIVPGPVEAARERAVWLGVDAETDVFGKLALSCGATKEALRCFLANETVCVGGKTGSSFDLTEDVDTAAAVAAVVEVSKARQGLL